MNVERIMETDSIKQQFWDAGFLCFQLTPIKWRIRGQDGAIDVFPVLGKFKRYGPAESSDDLVATARQYLMPFEPSVTPELEAHRDRLDCLSYEVNQLSTGGFAGRS